MSISKQEKVGHHSELAMTVEPVFQKQMSFIFRSNHRMYYNFTREESNLSVK